MQAAGREVVFAWREDRRQLRMLLDAGLLRTTALTTFSFDAWEGATEEELVQFAFEVSRLCCIAAQQHIGLPVVTFLDAQGWPIKRTILQPIESAFRSRNIFPVPHADNGLPQLFRQCFEELARLYKTPEWMRLHSIYCSVEDPPYLEQKLASLMSGAELIMRLALIEGGYMSAEEAESKVLPELIGAARKLLKWDVPKHYTEKDKPRVLRNAVSHGGGLPNGATDARHEFDKWRLFLQRRLLIRLGFNGEVESPEKGFASSSTVNDFTERSNSFRRP